MKLIQALDKSAGRYTRGVSDCLTPAELWTGAEPFDRDFLVSPVREFAIENIRHAVKTGFPALREERYPRGDSIWIVAPMSDDKPFTILYKADRVFYHRVGSGWHPTYEPCKWNILIVFEKAND